MPKIAFLFLIISSLFHEGHWLDFFKGHENQCSIYIHAKHEMEPSPFKQHELPFKVPNSWARTMNSQVAMLREALKDPDNQKFVFVSHNTIPLQNFDFVYRELMSHDKSMFNYEPSYNLEQNYAELRKFDFIPPEKHYKNPQWVVLTRKHAQMMVDDKTYLHRIIRQPHDQEHYPSIFLAMHNLLKDEVIKKSTTCVQWNYGKRPPCVFDDENLQDPLIRSFVTDAIRYGVLFARKFAKETTLKILDESLSYRNSTSPHTFEFQDL